MQVYGTGIMCGETFKKYSTHQMALIEEATWWINDWSSRHDFPRFFLYNAINQSLFLGVKTYIDYINLC